MTNTNEIPKPYTERERAIARATFANLVTALFYNDKSPDDAFGYLLTSARSATQDCHSPMCGFETIFDNCLEDAVNHVGHDLPLAAATVLKVVDLRERYLEDWNQGQRLMRPFWRKFKTPEPEFTGNLRDLLVEQTPEEIAEARDLALKYPGYGYADKLLGRG